MTVITGSFIPVVLNIPGKYQNGRLFIKILLLKSARTSIEKIRFTISDTSLIALLFAI
jgi:hypothetical protein